MIWGKITSIAIVTNSTSIKGKAPRVIVSMGISGATPLIIKRFSPIGGVNIPTSISFTTSTPNPYHIFI